jgi:hypothetical protein
MACRPLPVFNCYGASGEEAIFVAGNERTECPMPQPNDLSRCLAALNQHNTLIAVIEMSQSRWITRITVAYEAGLDGFWLARWLRAREIEAKGMSFTRQALPCHVSIGGQNRPARHRIAQACLSGLDAR